MKLFFILSLLSLVVPTFANAENCLINKKHKGIGTLTEKPSHDGNGLVIMLEIKIKGDFWRGNIARKDFSGNFNNINTKASHKYATELIQKVKDSRITYDYLNPGYKSMNSKLKTNAAHEIISVSGKEIIFNDFGRVEGKNTFSCEF